MYENLATYLVHLIELEGRFRMLIYMPESGPCRVDLPFAPDF